MARKTTKAVEPKTEAVKTVAAPKADPAPKAAPAEKAAPAPKAAPAQKADPAPKAAPAVKAEAPAKETAAKAAAEKKPAAKRAAKAPAKAAAEKKAPAAKRAAKAPAEKKAPAKRGPKPKPVTLDDIVAKLRKKISAAKAAKLTGTIAVDVEVWGWEDGSNKHLYIEVKDGKADVQPYEYEAYNFKAFISFADAMAVVDGKLSIMDALLSGKLNVIGVVGDAVKLGSIF